MNTCLRCGSAFEQKVGYRRLCPRCRGVPLRKGKKSRPEPVAPPEGGRLKDYKTAARTLFQVCKLEGRRLPC